MNNKGIEWKSLGELFEHLNSVCNYLVLRNFEKLLTDFFLDEEEDIDILCDNKLLMIETLGAVPINPFRNGDNYFVIVNSKVVKMDIRYVGDGYYDSQWEKKMLEDRVLLNCGFYVMDKENYFYSLIYHALIQKPRLSEDYRDRLEMMAKNLELSISSEAEMRGLLNNYMKAKGYYYTNTADPGVFLNFSNISQEQKKIKNTWLIRKYLNVIYYKMRIIVKEITPRQQ